MLSIRASGRNERTVRPACQATIACVIGDTDATRTERRRACYGDRRAAVVTAWLATLSDVRDSGRATPAISRNYTGSLDAGPCDEGRLHRLMSAHRRRHQHVAGHRRHLLLRSSQSRARHGVVQAAVVGVQDEIKGRAGAGRCSRP